MIDLNWEKFWRDQNRILEIFFDFLIVEKGLSQNTVFSYKRDFKLLSLYLYNSAWFKKNVSPQKRQKDFYHSIDNRFNKNKLTSLRHLNHKILREFFYLLKEKGFKTECLVDFPGH